MCIRDRSPVVMPDTAPASHAGNSCTDKITHPFYRLNLLPIPSYHSPCKGARPVSYTHLDVYKRQGARPLCYFLGEKVTSKSTFTPPPRWGVSMKVLLEGLDPEVGGGVDKNIYPRPVTFSLGLVAQF